MELPQQVIKEAKRLVEHGAALPAFIAGSAGFYVAVESDSSILAFSGIEIQGVTYKIGTNKK